MLGQNDELLPFEKSILKRISSKVSLVGRMGIKGAMIGGRINATLLALSYSTHESPMLSKAFCITMRGNRDRQIGLLNSLKKTGLDLFFFEATTTQTLPMIHHEGPIINRATQLACLISHLRLLRLLANNTQRNEFYLVIEDDVILREDIREVQVSSLVPDDWGIIQLGCSNPIVVKSNIELYSRYGLNCVTWVEGFSGAYAYIIRHDTCCQISKRLLTPAGDLDLRGYRRPRYYVADHILFDAANTYTLCSPLANFNHSYSSDIGYNAGILNATKKASCLVDSHWSNLLGQKTS